MCICVFEYVCASMCVCVPFECVSEFVRVCVRVVSRAKRILTSMRMHVRTWAEGGKEKFV